MADESATVDQQSMVEDFFSDPDGIVNQDTGEDVIKQSSDVDKEDITPETGKETEAKQQETKAPETKSGQKPAELPKDGFLKEFVKTDEQGQESFDADKAFDFFMPGDGKPAFEAKAPVAAPVEKAPETPAKPAEPELKPWEKEIKEEREFIQSVHTNLMSPINAYREAIKAGYQPEQALAYAEQAVQQAVEQVRLQRQDDSRMAEKKRTYEEMQEMKEMAAIEPLARSNIASLANHVGGQQKLDALMFGKDTGGPIVNMLFDLSNPDNKKPTQQDLGKWWTKFASDPNRLNFVFEMAQARVQKALWPQLVSHIRNTKASQDAQLKQGTMRAPSSIATKEPAPKDQGPDAIQDYFGQGYIPIGGAFDEV